MQVHKFNFAKSMVRSQKIRRFFYESNNQADKWALNLYFNNLWTSRNQTNYISEYEFVRKELNNQKKKNLDRKL